MRIDGVEVKRGDIVSFKSDYEQCGRVTAMQDGYLTLESLNVEGFGGDYIGGRSTTRQHVSNCWLD